MTKNVIQRTGKVVREGLGDQLIRGLVEKVKKIRNLGLSLGIKRQSLVIRSRMIDFRRSTANLIRGQDWNFF